MATGTDSALLTSVESLITKTNVPEFKTGDTLKVHAKVVEGNKERIQIFEGVVIKRHKGVLPSATFTVRKVSYNIGVERTFFLHSPRIDRIEIVGRGKVKRARLFHLRPLRGKAAKIKTKVEFEQAPVTEAAPAQPVAEVASAVAAE